MQVRHAQDTLEFDLKTFDLLTHEMQCPRFPYFPSPVTMEDHLSNDANEVHQLNC